MRTQFQTFIPKFHSSRKFLTFIQLAFFHVPFSISLIFFPSLSFLSLSLSIIFSLIFSLLPPKEFKERLDEDVYNYVVCNYLSSSQLSLSLPSPLFIHYFSHFTYNHFLIVIESHKSFLFLRIFFHGNPTEEIPVEILWKKFP